MLKRNIVIILFAFICLLFNSNSNANIVAQTKTVTGLVTDNKGESIVGANIKIKDGSIGVSSDVDGKFSIQLPEGKNELEVSYIGYLKQLVTVKKPFIKIILEENSQMLDELVITGYGSLKKSNITSAQVTISSKDIEKTLNTTLDQALQGRVAGVSVTSNSGQPGGGVSVTVRGLTTINGTGQPLYVIDGVQISGESQRNSVNPIANINPSDIESLEVLQGPSATAMYGSRASNGVILISTKRGKSGRDKIDYEYSYSIQETPTLLPTINFREYAILNNQLRDEMGWPRDANYINPSVLGEGSNWQRELFGNAPMSKHQFSMSGGNDKTKYFTSMEYLNQDGVAYGSGFERFSTRLNFDYSPKKWLTINSNVNLSQTTDKLTVTNDGIINMALSQSPATPVRNVDGTWGSPPDAEAARYADPNPIALATLIDNTLKRYTATAAITAVVHLPIKGFQMVTHFNTSYNVAKNSRFEPSYQMGFVSNPIAKSEKNNSDGQSWYWSQQLQYNNTFAKKHNLSAVFVHESMAGWYAGLSGSRENFVSNAISELSAGDLKTSISNSYLGQWAMESYLGRINYSLLNRYILQTTLRADGSPNFAPKNRWGYFPSGSVAWRVSEEPFIQNFKKQIKLEEFKLRFEAGLTGNQGEAGGYFVTLAAVPSPWGTGFRPTNYANSDYKWEETMTYNVGLNLSLLKNRIQFEFDYFYKETKNMLMSLQLPEFLGTSTLSVGYITPPTVNLGAMLNSGFGITLTTVNVDNGKFRWTTNFNISKVENKLTKLYSDNSFVDRTFWQAEYFNSRSSVGSSLWQFYGYIADGIYENDLELKADYNRRKYPELNSLGNEDGSKLNSALPADTDPNKNSSWVGDIKFRDLDNNGVIDERDRTNIGTPWPDFTYGFTNSFSYRNFDFSILLVGSQGNEVVNYVKFLNSQPARIADGMGMLRQAFDRARLTTWIDDGGISHTQVINTGTTIPRINPTDAHGNRSRITNWNVEDASFLRIKSIQLNYNIPSSLLQKTKFVETFRVGVSVQNAFTFTKYTGYDPEIGYTISGNTQAVRNAPIGLDFGRYPQTRIYSCNILVGF